MANRRLVSRIEPSLTVNVRRAVRDPMDRAGASSLRVDTSMIRRALGPAGINVVHATGKAAWQTVLHFHLHLAPPAQGDRVPGRARG